MGNRRGNTVHLNRRQTWLTGEPQEVSPWRPRGWRSTGLVHAWVRLGTWELGMGVILFVVFGFGTQLIASAPHQHRHRVRLHELLCRAARRAAMRTRRVPSGGLEAGADVGWLLLMAVPRRGSWDLWSVAAQADDDDFLKLLEDSFARDWRKPRTWPWTRVASGPTASRRWRHSGSGACRC